MTPSLRWGIIGTGAIAGDFARALHGLETVFGGQRLRHFPRQSARVRGAVVDRLFDKRAAR